MMRSSPEPAGAGRSPARRALLRGGAVAAGAALGAVSLHASLPRRYGAAVDLHSQTVALTSADALERGGSRTLITDLDALLPGTRIHRDATGAELLAAAEAALLDAAPPLAREPSPAAPAASLLREAVLDLHALSAGLPAPVAGWSRNWRYVWPRDAAHAARALAQIGQPERSRGTLHELARLMGEDGWFQARYLPGTRQVPDGRTRQLDGTGWFLWACHEVHRLQADAAGSAHAGLPALLGPRGVQAVVRGCSLLRELSASGARGRHLPPASPDYWEVPERRLTIATAALVLVGLERGAALLEMLDHADAHATAERAEHVRAAIHETFGPAFRRYPVRSVGISRADAGMLFLLPPYTLQADERVVALLGQAEESMRRPAGGVAPGAGWKLDGISWTPQTAMFAQAHSLLGVSVPGHRGEAARLLQWLAAHRTAAGSLPEKVLADGSPAAVAPLAWTASLVIGALMAS